MTNTLIVNLEKNLDLNMLAATAQTYAIAKKTQVSLLVLDEVKTAQNATDMVEKIFTINLQEMVKCSKHRIFSNFEMVNELQKDLNVINQNNWDEVINLGEDEASLYLVRCLQTKLLKGKFYNDNRIIYSSNLMAQWRKQHSFLHQQICMNDGLEIASIIEEANAEAEVINTKRYALELASGQHVTPLSYECLVELVQGLTYIKNDKIDLIVREEERQTKLIMDLQERFPQNLSIVEASISQLKNVLKGYDLVICQSHYFKTLCDQNGVTSFTIYHDYQSLYQNCSLNPNSLSLYLNKADVPFIKGAELIQCINFAFIKGKVTANLDLETLELYRLNNKQILVPISKNYNVGLYLKMILEKGLYREVQYQTWLEYKTELTIISDRELATFIQDEKESLSLVVKNTLNAIRLLKNFEHTQGNVKELVTYIDRLMNERSKDSATNYLLDLFKHQMEHLDASSREDNLIKTEKALINLKNHLQTLTRILGDMAETINERRKAQFSGINI